MKINSSLDYVPVAFSELTSNDEFWKGCYRLKLIRKIDVTYKKNFTYSRNAV